MNKILLLLLTMGMCFSLSAQDMEVIQSWDFEDGTLGGWVKMDQGDTIFVSDEVGSNAVKLTTNGIDDRIGLRNTTYKDLKVGDVFSFDVYISADDLTRVNGSQPHTQTDGWGTWADQWVNASDLTADGWSTISYTISEGGPLDAFGYQLLTMNADDVVTFFVDNISISRTPEWSTGPDYANWDFETGELENWVKMDDGDTIFVSDEQASSGTYSIKLTTNGVQDRIGLRNTTYKDLLVGDVLSFDVYFSADDMAKVNGSQPHTQTDGWGTWTDQWYNGTDLVADGWTTITLEISADGPLDAFGYQVLGMNAEDIITYYVDNIKVIRNLVVEPGTALTLESEDAVLGPDITTATDSLDVTYIDYSNFTESASMSTTYPEASRVAIYTTSFPTAGTYDLYARVYVGPGGGDDDSFLAPTSLGPVNPGAADGWISTNQLNAGVGYTEAEDIVDGGGTGTTEMWKWFNVSSYNGIQYEVEEGETENIEFYIGGREDGLLFDKISFGDATYTYTVANLDGGEVGTAPAEPVDPGVPVILESELATLGAQINLGTDATTGEEYIDYFNFTESSSMSTGHPEAERVAVYNVTFPEAGAYDLYVRVFVENPDDVANDDSFHAPTILGAVDPTTDDGWITMNGLSSGWIDPADVVTSGGTAGGNGGGGVWKWLNISAQGGGVTYEAVEGSLENNEFHIGGRENGLFFDKIAFGRSSFAYTVADLDAGVAGTTSNEDYSFTPNLSIASISPTPFSNATQIDFSLENSGNTIVEVYNAVGSRVSLLVNTHMTAGSHSVNWTPQSNLTGGVYYIALTNGSERVIQRTVYLK